MTAQEKAQELVDKFGKMFVDNYGIKAKQCALIAVDEIMNSYESTNDHHGTVYKYWQQVKEEIEKL